MATNTPLHIRVARQGDSDTVRQIARCAYEHYVERIGREPAPMTADYVSLIASGLVRVAAAGGELVGVLVIEPRNDHLFLENIAVHPDHRGQGIGRQLMRAVEDEARTLNLPEIRLYTNAVMTENLSWYPRLGFVETDRMEEDGFNRVYFHKRL